MHIPVFLQEVLTGLDPRSGQVIFDGTIGYGGHAAELLSAIGLDGLLIGIDKDLQAIAHCSQRFRDKPNVKLFNQSFSKTADLVLPDFDAILLDLGVSSLQIDTAERGFAFDTDGPLDMRMNAQQPVSAYHIINEYPEERLSELLFNYGEEPKARAITRSILRHRKQRKIETTGNLKKAVLGGLGNTAYSRRQQTLARVFQAIRIEVNHELDDLSAALPILWQKLKPEGKMAVIAFHSLEDRIVKRFMLDTDSCQVIKPFPVKPDQKAITDNPRSRSAKLRFGMKNSRRTNDI